jgi:DNA-directed RNA polymerase specialized sigma subunit
MLTQESYRDSAGSVAEKLAADTPAEREAELTAWRQWKKTRDPASFSFLVDRYQRVFTQDYTMRHRGAQIPKSAIKSNQIRLFIDALDNYDPSKSQLITHVVTNLQHSTRYTRRYQNIARLPDDKALKVDKIQNRAKYLEQFLGRAPTTQEIADDMATSPAQVDALRRQIESIQKTQRRELSMGSEFMSMQVHESDPVMDKIWHLHHQFNPEQQGVLEHRFGLFGKPRLKTLPEIASALSMTPARARTVHRQVKEKLDELLAQDLSWRK